MFFNVFIAETIPISPPPSFSAYNSIKIKEAKKGEYFLTLSSLNTPLSRNMSSSVFS